jgi:hypothetical protein
MQVQIKHNGTTITSRVIAYSREHQICSSIGRLQLTLEGTYATTIEPHDSIDIFESGDFKVRYYVSQVSKNIPDNIITLECQDKSKYIVDYFIPDTYTIDYPSYTRYWIEKFLTEAGISYSFTTSSQGNLLSNNTALGLQPAYDQIMMLLQLSGWFMYFDGNGIAVIGTLDTNLADSAGSINNSDILDIKRITDDKMLRNRAVVWGQFDPIRQEYAYADIRRHTPWNYDHNDLRSMVISNSNIPNKSSAYSIANILLKEFARATIEKHIVVHGARDYNLGESLRVNSRIWRGKGLITTFGVSMDRNGLVTNIILDERCPRLFGFFNFGDYVYVGTFGDGVWRKHIKFDPTWYNFSTGLIDLNITDLHINNGIFGAIGHSGAAYYANNEEGPWSQVTITGLSSSVEDVIPSGGTVIYTQFSGLMARAVVVDKEINTVKYGIDTWSGLNTGDYFLTYSGLQTSSGIFSFSGVMESGTLRSWIVEVDPYTGALVGGLGSGTYPVVYSGNYSMAVLDLENDGRNDYVSVMTEGQLITGNAANQEFNYGTNLDHDGTARVSLSNINDPVTTVVDSTTSNTSNHYKFFMEDNVGAHHFVLIRRTGGTVNFSRTKYKTDNVFFQFDSNQNANSTLINSIDQGNPLHSSSIYKIGVDKYRRYICPELTFSTSTNVPFHVHDFEFTGASTVTETLVTINTSPPVDMDFSAPPFPNSLQVNVRTYFFERFAILVWSWNYIFLGAIKNTKVWYQLFDYENTTLGTAVKVYEAGGLDDKAVLILHKFGDANFQTVGEHTVISTNAVHPLYGTDFDVNEDVTALFTGAVAETQDYTLSETVSVRWFRLSGGLNNYANYGVNGYQTLLKTADPFDYDPAQTRVEITYLKEVPNVVFSIDNDTGSITNSRLKRNSISPLMGTTWTEIALGTGLHTNFFPMERIDSVTGNMYALARNTPGALRFLEIETEGWTVVRTVTGGSFPAGTTARNIPVRNVGNFALGTFPNNSAPAVGNFGLIIYQNLAPPLGTGTSFMVLQREGSEFNLIQQASKPLRVDISNYSPVLTVQDNENTFQSNFVYEDSLTQVIPVLLETTQIRDYRYTLLETSSGIIVGSGAAVGMQAIYVSSSGIYTSDVDTYSGGFIMFGSSPSGLLDRIETSNYTYPGQFLFVTTSGENPTFYQKDNDSLIFDTYPGLPDSRCTIIRLDDRF